MLLCRTGYRWQHAHIESLLRGTCLHLQGPPSAAPAAGSSATGQATLRLLCRRRSCLHPVYRRHLAASRPLISAR